MSKSPEKLPGLMSPEGGEFKLALPLPHPIITRRTRTNSTTQRALNNPIDCGTVKNFCRSKGHGFITPINGGEDVFVHISDIEGEYVPRVGDEVTYRVCPIPPKMEKFQAVHVNISHFSPEVHLKWDSPLNEEERDEASSNKPEPV